MHWPYIIAAIAVLLLAGFLKVRHDKQVNRRLLIEMQEGMAKAYRDRMIACGELPADDEAQNNSLHEIIDAKWRKEGKHT